MKILVIEDEPELNELSVESLRAAGHEVWSALSLGEAWEVFESLDYKVDLIIADKRLPDGNGAEFALTIREKYPKVTLAMVSAFITPQEESTLAAESIRCYRKPALYRKVAEDARRRPPPNAPVFDPRQAAPAAEAVDSPATEAEAHGHAPDRPGEVGEVAAEGGGAAVAAAPDPEDTAAGAPQKAKRRWMRVFS